MIGKRGISGVVITMILMVLVVAVGAVVISLTQDTVKENIERSKSCGPDLIGKVSFMKDNICYNESSETVVFGLERGDIDLDSLLVSIESEESSFNFELVSDSKNFSERNKSIYPFSKNWVLEGEVAMPSKKSGSSYIVTNVSEKPTGIKLIPTVNRNQCKALDEVSNIVSCSRLSTFN